MRWLGALLLLLVLNTGLKVLAWQESPAPDPLPRFVQVGEVQITDLTPAEGKGLVDRVGRLNLAIVHFPLAWFTFVVAGLCLVAMGLRWRRSHQSLGRWRITYLVLILTASVLVLVSGGLGGRLAHGPSYLPF